MLEYSTKDQKESVMSKALQTMEWMAPGGNLNAYIQGTSTVPILTIDEERALGESLYYQEDLDAARRMVMAHLRFVVHIARSYNGYGLPLADLIQEGNVGLEGHLECVHLSGAVWKFAVQCHAVQVVVEHQGSG